MTEAIGTVDPQSELGKWLAWTTAIQLLERPLASAGCGDIVETGTAAIEKMNG